MKILLIEDDEEISQFIKGSLEADSSMVDVSPDGNNGSFLARTNVYDAIIIDYALPTKNGIMVCEDIRGAGVNTPIIFLTIHSEIRKKVLAFEKGADDYMIKPFSIIELRARLYALCRRPPKIDSPLLVIGDLVLDTQKRTVYRGKTQVYLTRKTYNLLEYLMRNKGVVLSRGSILEYVWSSDGDPFSNTVEAHILNLRKKINIMGKKDMLKNIAGRGYIMSE